MSDDATILAPASREGFLVVVYGFTGDAEDAEEILRSQRTADSFDARVDNVLVTADERVAPRVRARIGAALAELG